MIGTPVQATLWEVHYRHLSAERERAPEPRTRVAMNPNPFISQLQAAEIAARAEAAASQYVLGRVFVLTSDPTGEDLLRVARRAVLGASGPWHDFAIIQANRMADSVRGLATLDARPE